MALVFKAPVEFFHSDLYPDRCLLTGRAENLHHFDLQLPYLNAGIAAIVIPLRPNDPPPAAAADLPADEPRSLPDAADSATPPPPPLPQQRKPVWSILLGIAVWLFLFTWLGYLIGNETGAWIGFGVSLGWVLIYSLALRKRHRRKVDAQAHHFTIALAEPTPAERRNALLLQLSLAAVNLVYYVVLAGIALPPDLFPNFHLPFQVGFGAFWIAWLCFIGLNGWRNRQFPILRLYPKQRELEIRLPDARKHLYDDLCTRFMRWKHREQFETAIRYDIDSEVDDFPDVDSGSWDQGERR